MKEAPEVNTIVMLDIAGWTAPLKTRVEELGEVVTVADPVVGDSGHEPSLGSAVHLRWHGARGPSEMSATLVATEQRSLKLWHLRPDGEPVVNQRRDFARAEVLLPVALDTDGGTVDGHLADLSEGGLKAVCPSSVELAVSDRVRVQLTVGGTELALDSEVVRVQADKGQLYAGCRFVDIDEQRAHLIRKYVFERQMEQRRS